MKYYSAVLLFNLCTTLYAQRFDPLDPRFDTSLTCENGVPPRVTCDDTSAGDSSCSCRCTNGINIDRPFSYFLQGNGSESSSSENCEAIREQMQLDAKACAAHRDDLNAQLHTCTLRERDASSQAETCAVRERHTVDQLEACNIRANNLVDQFGACVAGEKESNVQLEACTAREKSLNDQLEASKDQIAENIKTIADLEAEIAKLEKTYLKQKYKGCYTDVIPRMLNGAQKVGDASMTTEKCSTFCKSFTYFGTQFGEECYCGNQLKSEPVVDSQCDMICKGNNQQKCGGRMRLSVYQIL